MTLWTFPGNAGHVLGICEGSTRENCLWFGLPISLLFFMLILWHVNRNVWLRAELDSFGRKKPQVNVAKLPDIAKAIVVSVLVGDVASDVFADFAAFRPFECADHQGSLCVGTSMLLTSCGLPALVLMIVACFTFGPGDWTYVANTWTFPQNAREKIDLIADIYSALLSVLSVVVYIWATYDTAAFQMNTLPDEYDLPETAASRQVLFDLMTDAGCTPAKGPKPWKPNTNAYTANLCLLMALRVDYVVRFLASGEHSAFFFSSHNLLDFLSISDLFAWLLAFQFKKYTHSFGFLRYPRILKVTRLGFVKDRMGATYHKIAVAVLVIFGVIFMFGGLILTVEFPCRSQAIRHNELIGNIVDGASSLLNGRALGGNNATGEADVYSRGSFAHCPLGDYWDVYCLHTALYFASVTLTTIGYGDYSPMTPEGQIITVLSAIGGIGVITTYTTSLFSAITQFPHDSKFKPSSDTKHVILVVLGAQKDTAVAQFVNEYFSFNHGNDKRKVVILSGKSSSEKIRHRLQAYGNFCKFLLVDSMTDPVDMAIAFERAGLYDYNCECIFLSSDEHSSTPTSDDYLTLLWTMAIRKNLAQHMNSPPIVAMVIEKQSKDAVITAGADCVLCARELKSKIFSNSLRTKAYIPLFSNLLHSNSSEFVKEAKRLEGALSTAYKRGVVDIDTRSEGRLRGKKSSDEALRGVHVGWEHVPHSSRTANLRCLSSNAVEVAEYIRGTANCFVEAALTRTHLSVSSPGASPVTSRTFENATANPVSGGLSARPPPRASFQDVTEDGPRRFEGRRFGEVVSLLKLLPSAGVELEQARHLLADLPQGLRVLPNVLLIGVRTRVQEKDPTRYDDEYDVSFFQKSSGNVLLNPGANYEIKPGDFGIFISCNLEEKLYTMRTDLWLPKYLQKAAECFSPEVSQALADEVAHKHKHNSGTTHASGSGRGPAAARTDSTMPLLPSAAAAKAKSPKTPTPASPSDTSGDDSDKAELSPLQQRLAQQYKDGQRKVSSPATNEEGDDEAGRTDGSVPASSPPLPPASDAPTFTTPQRSPSSPSRAWSPQSDGSGGSVLMCGSLHTMMEVLEIECKADRTRDISVLHPELTEPLLETAADRARSPTAYGNPDSELESVLTRLGEMRTTLRKLKIVRGSALDIRALERAGIDDCAIVVVLSSKDRGVAPNASRRLRVSYGLAAAETEEDNGNDDLQPEVTMDMDNVKIIRLIRQHWQSKNIITELANPTSLAYVEPTSWWPQDHTVGQDFNLAPAYAAGDVYNTQTLSTVLCTSFFKPWLLDVINDFAVGPCYIRHAPVEAKWFGNGASLDTEGRATGTFSQVFHAMLEEKQAIILAVLKRARNGNGEDNAHGASSSQGTERRRRGVKRRTQLTRQESQIAQGQSVDGKLPILITNPSNQLEVNTDDYVLVIPSNTQRLHKAAATAARSWTAMKAFVHHGHSHREKGREEEEEENEKSASISSSLG